VAGFEHWLIPSHFVLHWSAADTVWAILIVLAWFVLAGWVMLILYRLCMKHDDHILKDMTLEERKEAFNHKPFWWEKYLKI
jgi:hypothetical protein